MGCCCSVFLCQLKPSPTLEQLEWASLMGWLLLQLPHQLWFLLPRPPPLVSVLDIYFCWLDAGSTSQVKIQIVCAYPVLLD